jgi:hypothetical protein
VVDQDTATVPKGATAFGVRLLDRSFRSSTRRVGARLAEIGFIIFW